MIQEELLNYGVSVRSATKQQFLQKKNNWRTFDIKLCAFLSWNYTSVYNTYMQVENQELLLDKVEICD